MLRAWFDQETDVYYFFMPAFVNTQKVYFDHIKGMHIAVNGKEIQRWSSLQWEENRVYRILLGGEKELGLQKEILVKFVQAQNLPAVFISTDSKSMEYLDADKNNAEAGRMSIVMSDGKVDYNGRLERISGRGNATWSVKKPYTIRLMKGRPLCGVGSGKKWCLLALARENSNLSTMLAYQMADYLDMDYVPGAVWVDLYLNGAYNGIYLLSEAVTTGRERVNVPDEYLLEMDNIYYTKEPEQNCFMTERGNHFVVGGNVSENKLKEIQQMVQKVEDSLASGNYQEYFDLDAYVKRYLINEIALNIDSDLSSVYYYLEPDSYVLHAGPIWDYDICFGVYSYYGDSRNNADYQSKIRDYEWLGFSWTELLYEREEFNHAVRTNYEKLLPFLEDMLNQGIDDYAEYIRASSEMDNIRWKGKLTGYYRTYANNVRYLKFYLANRLNYLNQVWGIPYKKFEIPSEKKMHQVSFLVNDRIIRSITIPDGKTVENLSEIEVSASGSWFLGDRVYTDMIPVYEDVVLKEWP